MWSERSHRCGQEEVTRCGKEEVTGVVRRKSQVL